MEKAAANKTTTSSGSGQKPAINGWVIAVQLLDTAWRVALPILVLCYVGIKLDKHYGTTPLYSLLGLFLSLIVASLLVYRQIKIAYPDFFKKTGGQAK